MMLISVPSFLCSKDTNQRPGRPFQRMDWRVNFCKRQRLRPGSNLTKMIPQHVYNSWAVGHIHCFTFQISQIGSRADAVFEKFREAEKIFQKLTSVRCCTMVPSVVRRRVQHRRQPCCRCSRCRAQRGILNNLKIYEISSTVLTYYPYFCVIY